MKQKYAELITKYTMNGVILIGILMLSEGDTCLFQCFPGLGMLSFSLFLHPFLPQQLFHQLLQGIVVHRQFHRVIRDLHLDLWTVRSPMLNQVEMLPIKSTPGI